MSNTIREELQRLFPAKDFPLDIYINTIKSYESFREKYPDVYLGLSNHETWAWSADKDGTESFIKYAAKNTGMPPTKAWIQLTGDPWLVTDTDYPAGEWIALFGFDLHYEMSDIVGG